MSQSSSTLNHSRSLPRPVASLNNATWRKCIRVIRDVFLLNRIFTNERSITMSNALDDHSAVPMTLEARMTRRERDDYFRNCSKRSSRRNSSAHSTCSRSNLSSRRPVSSRSEVNSAPRRLPVFTRYSRSSPNTFRHYSRPRFAFSVRNRRR